MRRASSTGESLTGFPNISNRQSKLESPLPRSARGLFASSFEFVAKPEQARNAVQLLPGEIHSGLEDLAGFAGSVVMVSDQEARLISVILFWNPSESGNGHEASRSCERSVRRVRALLAPYLDRCVRVQNLFAHFPQQEPYSQASSIDTHLITEDSIAQEANVCAA